MGNSIIEDIIIIMGDSSIQLIIFGDSGFDQKDIIYF